MSLLDGATLSKDNRSITERKSFDLSRQVSLNMENLLKEFAGSFFRDGKSPMTTKNYLKNLRQFFKERGILSIEQIDKESIQNWMTVLRQRTCGTGFIVAHLWALKAFLAFLKKEKKIACYDWDISIPEVPAAEAVEFLEMDELENIFALLKQYNICDLRLRVYIELMINTGMRPNLI